MSCTSDASSSAIQANMDNLVRSLGHLILMKVDPAAARRRNLSGLTPDRGSDYVLPEIRSDALSRDDGRSGNGN